MTANLNSIAGPDRQQYPHPAEARSRWYAAYTSANHEKKVAAEMSRRGVESFLPLYQAVRKWSDRRVQLDLPLFPGYVFVRIGAEARRKVLEVPGVATIVGFGGLPAALPDEQMEALRAGLVARSNAEPHAILSAGRRVRVRSGPFAGIEGIVIQRKNRLRLVISLELIQRALAVDVDLADVEAVLQRRIRT